MDTEEVSSASRERVVEPVWSRELEEEEADAFIYRAILIVFFRCRAMEMIEFSSWVPRIDRMNWMTPFCGKRLT